MKKIFVEDSKYRVPPSADWIVVTNVDDFIAHVDKLDSIEEISFDYHLGDKEPWGGLQCATYIFQKIRRNNFPRFKWKVHSEHPDAKHIREVMQRANQIWDKREESA